jgi:hypothetical protein
MPPCRRVKKLPSPKEISDLKDLKIEVLFSIPT